MPELGPDHQTPTQESFSTRLDIAPGQADVPERPQAADVIDFQAAAEKRRAARADIDRLTEAPAPPEELPAEPAPSAEPGEVIPLVQHRGRNLITGPLDQHGRPAPTDRLTEVRPGANALLSRMVQDRAFAKQLLGKKDLGSDYSSQGISEAMAAAALPYVRRAMRAGKHGRRYERMDSYMAASSDAANAIGNAMDLENRKLASHNAGLQVREMKASGSMADYEPRKKPINYLKNRRLTQRLGIHLPALRRFK